MVRRADEQDAATVRPPVDRCAHRRAQDADRKLEHQPEPFVWHKTADQNLDGLKKYLTNLTQDTR